MTKQNIKRRGTKTAFLSSLLSLLLCVAMLVSTTFAWFTDTVTSGENQIIAGNLDVEVYYKTCDDNGTAASDWTKMDSTTSSLFSKGLWEPGHTEVVYLKIVNEGTLAFNYALDVTPVSESGGTNKDGQAFKLSDYIMFGTSVNNTESIYDDRADARDAVKDASMGLYQTVLHQTGVLYSRSDSGKQSESYASLVVYMPESVGNEANYKTGTAAPQITLGVKVYAWQEDYEKDSFGSDYDDLDNTSTTDYNYAAWSGESEKTPVSAGSETVLTIVKDTTVASTQQETLAKVTVPANTKVNDEDTALGENDKLQLVVEPTDEGNITVAATSSSTSYDVSLLKIVESEEPTEVTSSSSVMTVELYIGQVELQQFYHKGTELTMGTAGSLNENEYSYDQASGIVTFKTKSFSPFTAVYEFGGGIGTEACPYLIENKVQMQHITDKFSEYKYYKVADGVTTMDCSDWTPIKLYGSFDGNGITLDNLDNVLFNCTCNDRDGSGNAINIVTLANMTLNCNIFATSSAASLVRTAADDMVVDNVDVNGKIVGYSVGGYVDYGSGNWGDAKTRNWQVTFNDCINNAELVSYAEGIGGFIQHPYCDVTNGSTTNSLITVIDSAYVGKMISVSDNMDYFAYQGNNVRIKETYSAEFIEKYGEVSGVLHKACTADENGCINCGNYSAVNDRYRPNDSTNSTYKLKITNSGILPENYGELYTITKAENAVTAKVAYMINPNDNVNESGSYTGTYMSETIDVSSLETGATFKTQSIKYCKAVINGENVTSQGLSDDGKVYNVYDGGSFYGHTHNGANVYVVQYDADGSIVGITSFSVEGSNAIGVVANGNKVLSAPAGGSYTYETNVDLSDYNVTVKIYSRTVKTWCWDYTDDAVYKTLEVGTDYTINGSTIIINNVEQIHLTNPDLYNYFKENCRYVISYTAK